MSAIARKIVFLIGEDWFFKSHFLPMGRAARDSGFEVIVLTKPGRCRTELEAEGFRVVYVEFSRNALDAFSIFATIRRIARVLTQERPAVLHNLALKFALLGTIAGRLSGVPGIVNSITGLGHLVVARSVHMRILRWALWRVLPLVLNTPSSHLVFENADDAELAIRHHWTRRARIDILPGAGVDTRHYVALPDPPTAPVRVAVVCRMLWQKGVDTAIEAKRILDQRGISGELWLVGNPDPDNPHAYSPSQLEAWSKQPGVKWLGFVADIREVWRQCHIAIAPSRGGEGLPRSLIEAAACGRPLVATDVPGIRDITRTGINGFLIPPDDPDALADALESLIRDTSLRIAYGTASRRIAEAEYQESRVAEKVAALYDRASGNTRTLAP
ncbi:glycosyltransferase family 4 protein [Xanthobacteraceae bacterium Astr-EGSB]|uniref:glycosyltransferase family 4 protein n=1 Tax=Astrobacterium formosum TaxID=3069710 RepID=UPI0027B67962|nr:glycosyltransferase family 4 protein [Xanthobacteraceae bacterium Astr-EGSB]